LVRFPNKSVQRFWPPLADFATKTRDQGNVTRLSTSIHIHTEHPWTDPAALEILVVQMIECEPRSPDALLLAREESSASQQPQSQKASDQARYLPLCAPLFYHIFPKR